ncbi:hypothetical protein DFJ77DRAFT_458114 [Powellomyces hirtus]|nr:hypothetical protein DFJ77DRAFT_458114 [Powellomyces hirtus]
MSTNAPSPDDTANDDHLAQLMAMGFDYFLVRKALDFVGKRPTAAPELAVEDAMEWILRQTSVEGPSENEQPVLTLGAATRQRTETTSGIVTPAQSPPPGCVGMTPNRDDVTEEPTRRIEPRTGPSRRDCADMAMARRLEDAKKAKRSQGEAKSAILRQIAEDRQTLKERNARATPSDGHGLHAQPVERKPVAQSTASQSTIQFRLPSNTVLKSVFPATTPVRDLFDYVTTAASFTSHALPHEFTLLQPFPRRVFSREDDCGTIADAGLVPSATLNVIKSVAPPPSAPEPMEVDSQNIATKRSADAMDADLPDRGDSGDEDSDEDYQPPEEENDDEDDEEDEEEEGDEIEETVVRRPARNWGGGHRLTDAPILLPLPNPHAPDINDMEIDHGGNEGHHPAGVHRPVGNWGQGHLLTAQPGSDPAVRPDISTLLRPAPVPSSQPRSKLQRALQAPSLKSLCLAAVEILLTHANTPATHLRALPLLTSSLGDALVASLKRHARLTKYSLAKLGPVRFLALDLSHCRNVADSWFEIIARKWAFCLDRLVVAGCELITDKAVEALQDMRCLESLDLEGCRMTDGVARYLGGIPSLRTLSLAHTKLTTQGLRKLSLSNPHLQSLSIAHCAITTPDILVILACFTQLEALDMQRVPVTSPLVSPPVQTLSLRELDVAGTQMSDADLEMIVKMCPEVAVLKIHACPNVSVQGVKMAAESLENLTSITFPHGDVYLGPALPALYARPLARLDLAGNTYLFGDNALSGLERLAESLMELDLSGTKICDAALAPLAQLGGLTHLWLDRTPVTDAAFEHLLPLPDIHTLSVAATNITKSAVATLARSESARSIRVLNMARTRVDDEALPILKAFVNLTSLNLDWTACTLDAATHALKASPNIVAVRLTGLEANDGAEHL